MSKSDEIIAQRPATHGDYTEVATLTQSVLKILMSGSSWERLDSVKRDALYMISRKIGRIVTGDPNVEDHWRDIEGYAKLAADRIGPQAATSQGDLSQVSPLTFEDLIRL
jgi:hypothetical protein